MDGDILCSVQVYQGVIKIKMVLDKIGLNFGRVADSSPPAFNWTNYTKEQFIDEIPAQANALTGDYYGIIVLMAISVFLLWVLTEKTNYGFFRYSHIRALGLSLGIVSVLGVAMVQVGYMTNYIHLGILIALYSLMIIYTMLKNPDN